MKWFSKVINAIKNVFKKKEVVDLPEVVNPERLPNEERKTSDVAALKKGQIGVDISHHNYEVNLKTLCANVDFVYMKATEGTNFVSSKYLSRKKELDAIGINHGAYHYYKVNKDPIEQAKHFLKYIDVNSGLPPVLDIEGIGNNYKSHHTKDLLKFLRFIEDATLITPIIYTGYYFARDQIRPTQDFEKYPLWIAWYTLHFDRVKCPKPWKEIKIWQFTESGRMAGIAGDVDINEVMV